jgi:hypothetical protein
MSKELSPYLKVFELEPGASFKQITTRYYFCLEELPEKKTPEEKATEERLQHAYDILKRAYASENRVEPTIKKTRRGAKRSTTATAVVAIALVLAVGALLGMHKSDLQVKLTSYESGEVVRWKHDSDPYGKVLQFDQTHRFPTGQPSPAYEIQLAGQTDTVWIGERVVEKAMVAVRSR